MADEFSTAAVCEGGWWNPTRNMFGSSICSPSGNDIGRNLAWLNDDEEESVAGTEGRRPRDESAGGSASDDACMDSSSALQMLGIGRCRRRPSSSSSTSTVEWNQALMQDNEKGEKHYGCMVQEDLNYGQEIGEQSTNTGDYSLLEEQKLTSTMTTSSQELLSTGFPIDPYNYPQLRQQCLISGRPNSYAPAPAADYGSGLSGFSPSPPNFSSLLSPANHHLQLSSNIPSWNSPVTSANGVRPCFYPHPTFTDSKSVIPKKSNGNDELRDSSCSANKTSNEGEHFKQQRIEIPSPLPTFKVRKEKLGDRVTALQQLVSPFGKTDTASVLHEAIEYIKLLHDQLNVLINSYTTIESSSGHGQQTTERLLGQDLRGQGLCLVPMSSTFHVANYYWTPTFEANFR